MNDLSARVSKLEELIANVQQSNTGTTKQSKKQRQQLAAVDSESDQSSSNSTI
jgi:hypothetical protein